MGLKNFQIVFDNPWSTYYCGQPVTGRVLLNVDTPKKIRGIIIQFKGEADVKFDLSSSTRDRDGKTVNENVEYTANEIYFENKYNLVGGTTGETMLPAGEACYPFQTILPPNLPSSFEGEFGHVRYTVKVIIDRPWKFDQESKTAFTVISPLDLNLHPTARTPVKLTQEKFFCCCCCKSGPLTLVVSLPASGYVSGQQIPVTVEVDNISQQVVSDVTCTLRKLVAFHSRFPHKETKSDKITIGTISFGSVGKNGSETWAQLFDIPPLPPSNLANCGLIDLEYELKIEGKVSGIFHRNINVKIPLVFGTIPLAEMVPNAVPGMQPVPEIQPVPGSHPEGWTVPQQPDPNQPQYPGYPQGGNALYPSLPPPSFGEATGGAASIQDAGDNQFVQGDLQFTPRYPVYNFQNASAPPLG